jgi:hypothetical protein
MAGDELTRPTGGRFGPLDDQILQLADSHSPEEISEKMNGVLSPEVVASRLQMLLKSKNWLTAAQEDALITLKLKRVLVELEGKFLDIDNAKMRLSFLKEIGSRLDKRSAASETDLTKLYDNQGAIMGRVYDSALSYMKGALRESVNAELWDELAREALMNAQVELAKHQAIES